ncbi:hypothetical protein ACIPWL_28655 [Streptomyces sp. NPDC090023]|uniref:hypothetical protein n=1 Tax=unclassified Streptomyces TaxID=2593676 RepID=UPI0037FE8573
MADPDASTEDKETVAAVEAHVRDMQEQERKTRQREAAVRLEAEERKQAESRQARKRQKADRRELLGRRRVEDRKDGAHQFRTEKLESLFLAVRGALK